MKNPRRRINHENYDKDKNTSCNKKMCSQEIESQESFDETVGKTDRNIKEAEKLINNVSDEMMIVNGSETERVSDINKKEKKSCAVVINNTLNHENNATNLENNEIHTPLRITQNSKN